jgi:excisionase family DNA binding protein
MSKTYTVKQVADALGFSTNTVYKHLLAGKIKATRLGTTGRFRISESEVTRLLGEKGLLQPPEEPVILTPNLPEPAMPAMNQITNPNLFDWLLSLVAIFVGINLMLYPTPFQILTTFPFGFFFTFASLIAIPAGLILVAVSTFVSPKHHLLHDLTHVLVCIPFALLAICFSAASDITSAAYFVTLSLFSIVSIFWLRHSVIRFLFFLYALTAAIGIGFVLKPHPIIFFDLVELATNAPIPTLAFIISLSVILLVTSIIIHRNDKPTNFMLILWPTSAFYFYLCLNYINLERWTLSTIVLLTASFAAVFPFHRHMDTLSRFTRRQVAIAYLWGLAALTIGTALVYYNQFSFTSLTLSDSVQNTQTAAKVVTNYIDSAVKAVTSIAEFSKSSPSENLLRQTYNSSGTLSRIGVTDQSGTFTAVYPYFGSIGNFSVGNHEFFHQTKISSRTTISNLDGSNVYISAPITSPTGQFIGEVVATLDLTNLSSRLKDIRLRTIGNFYVTDHYGYYLVHPNSDLPGTLAPPSSFIYASIQGQTNQVLTYASDGNLSIQAFTPLGQLQWGLLLEQPYALAFQKASLTSFAILLVSMICGAGAIFVTIQLNHKS